MAILAAGLGLGAVSCDRAAVRVYQAPKDTPGTPSPPSEPRLPAWTAPAHWQELAPGMMQVAKFSVPADQGQAEITVSVLAGDAGGRDPNVNRWRGQMGLPPLDGTELSRSLLPLEIPDAKSYAVDLVAEAGDRRMVVAGVGQGGRTWFYKLAGDGATVAREKEAFLRFVQTAIYAP